MKPFEPGQEVRILTTGDGERIGTVLEVGATGIAVEVYSTDRKIFCKPEELDNERLGLGKDGAVACRGCGVNFKHDGQGPDVHRDECYWAWERVCLLAVEQEARAVALGAQDLDSLLRALAELDACRKAAP